MISLCSVVALSNFNLIQAFLTWLTNIVIERTHFPEPHSRMARRARSEINNINQQRPMRSPESILYECQKTLLSPWENSIKYMPFDERDQFVSIGLLLSPSSVLVFVGNYQRISCRHGRPHGCKLPNWPVWPQRSWMKFFQPFFSTKPAGQDTGLKS